MLRFKNFINEAASRSLSRLYTHIEKGRSVAFISAHRGDLKTPENNKRAKTLKADIKKTGNTAVPVRGEYVEDHKGKKIKVKEKTFMVVADNFMQLKKQMMKLGIKYDQDSILTVSKKTGSNFHGTGTSGWIKKGETQKVGGSGIADVKRRGAEREFGTQIGGKSFVLGGKSK
jgi:hypothetical protein